MAYKRIDEVNLRKNKINVETYRRRIQLTKHIDNDEIDAAHIPIQI